MHLAAVVYLNENAIRGYSSSARQMHEGPPTIQICVSQLPAVVLTPHPGKVSLTGAVTDTVAVVWLIDAIRIFFFKVQGGQL